MIEITKDQHCVGFAWYVPLAVMTVPVISRPPIMGLLLVVAVTLVPCARSEIYILDHLGPSSKVMMIPDLEATFGQSLPEEGLHGRLVQAHPLNGCHEMLPAPKHTTNNSMIAVISRYL